MNKPSLLIFIISVFLVISLAYVSATEKQKMGKIDMKTGNMKVIKHVEYKGIIIDKGASIEIPSDIKVVYSSEDIIIKGEIISLSTIAFECHNGGSCHTEISK